VHGSRRSPLWAKLLVITGAVLLLTSGTAIAGVNYALDRIDDTVKQRDLFRDLNADGEQPPSDLTGPLTFLLVGLDTRPSRPHEVPLADAIIIVHVPEALDHGYMISLPRDTRVDIPPYEPTGYFGGNDRINAAMSYGARQQPGEELPNIERGFELLSRTVSDLTGLRFDAGAVINFTGFTDVVDALKGVTVGLDETVTSRHRQPDGRHRPLDPGGNGFFGPQMVYEPGSPPCGPERSDGTFTCELNGWQALDIARQRYGVEGSDYGRQQHQQLIVRAMANKALSRDIATNPVAIDDVLRAAEGSLLFDGRGRGPVDFAFALRDLRPSDLVTIRLAADNLGTGNAYRGEQLRPESYELFEALRLGALEQFLLAHPEFVQ
jgi:polyisoprenyl-teichoic acid--peptidoglycan teichoic acid transferase